jgi:hypothetical protein
VRVVKAAANKGSNNAGNSAAADVSLMIMPANQVNLNRSCNASAKALEEAKRTAADAVKEKKQIRGELDKMKARLKAAEQGSGGRKTPT